MRITEGGRPFSVALELFFSLALHLPLLLLRIPAEIEGNYSVSTAQIEPNSANLDRYDENLQLQTVVEVLGHVLTRGHLCAATEHAVTPPVIREDILQHFDDCQRTCEDENLVCCMRFNSSGIAFRIVSLCE